MMTTATPLIVVNATTISDAWFQLLRRLPEAYIQPIQAGSFAGEQRRHQYPGTAISIAHPSQDVVPEIPPGLGVPPPTTQAYIEKYFQEYLMDPRLGPNETYTYATRINGPVDATGQSQLDRVVSLLKDTPYTNQAVIEVGSPSDWSTCWGKDGKFDPPCLRTLDFKVLPEQVLTVTCYFRSWDLWAGLPTNLGGIELLKQYVADMANLNNGPMYAYSAGLHLYGFQEELAKLRAGVRLDAQENCR